MELTSLVNVPDHEDPVFGPRRQFLSIVREPRDQDLTTVVGQDLGCGQRKLFFGAKVVVNQWNSFELPLLENC